MLNHVNNIQVTRKIISVLTGIAMIITLVVIRKYMYQQGPLIKGTPDLSPLYLFSTVAIILSLALLYFPFQNMRSGIPSLFARYNTTQRVSMTISITLSVLLCSALLINPQFFNQVSYEDHLIEWLSFGLLITGSLILMYSVKQLQQDSSLGYLRIPVLFFVVLYLLIAMEEVSWFTRALEVETPELFSGNDQNEINLHNFFTHYSENLYYVGTHLYFVVIPMLAIWIGTKDLTVIGRVFIAKPYLIVIAMIASSYNYNMWNSIFIQLTFFSSLMLLSIYYLKTSDSKERSKMLFFIGFLIATQVVYLLSGARYERLHEITEFKEFFIALTLMIYAYDIKDEINSLVAKKSTSSQAIS